MRKIQCIGGLVAWLMCSCTGEIGSAGLTNPNVSDEEVGNGSGGGSTYVSNENNESNVDVLASSAAEEKSVAPDDVVEDQGTLENGSAVFSLAAMNELVLRLDAKKGEHCAVVLKHDASVSGVMLSMDRWTGEDVVSIGAVDSSQGQAMLSVLDSEVDRTYWVRVHADEDLTNGNISIERTKFNDKLYCVDHCDDLIQLPLANDPDVDGYTYDGGTYFRYQFGRRDLVMMVRSAARTMANNGYAPIVPHDFSQWDGLTPGTDTGSLRHVSHKNGIDVDLSLYGSDGEAPWRSYCQLDGNSECISGTVEGFNGYLNAQVFGILFSSLRVTMSFLDQELIPYAQEGASLLWADNGMSTGVLDMFYDGTTLQHWPNHYDHIHVRVSEEAYEFDLLVE